MPKMSWLIAAAAAALAAACVSHPTSDTSSLGRTTDRARSSLETPAETQADASQSVEPQAAPTQSDGMVPGAYTEAQVSGFVAARDAIGRLTPAQTSEQQAANQLQISQILTQNGLTGDQYNAMAAAARTDQALANRIAAASVSDATFTDAQLQAFAQASAEIDPLNRSLATATPEQRSEAAMQIRSVLLRHNIDQATYNGIAARAQTDQALAQRIAQARTAVPQGSDTSGED